MLTYGITFTIILNSCILTANKLILNHDSLLKSFNNFKYDLIA